MIGGITTFHRADVQNVLLNQLGSSCHIHLSHRLISYVESESAVQLNFEGASTESCDLVVGADGIKSAVRKTLLEKLSKISKDHELSIEPSWSGTAAYRGLISSSLLAQHLPDHRALRTPMMVSGCI
jgi:salicylate hydroxylase